MAIKENGPSFLAPTLEKAIDILKNSEIFLPQFQSFKPEDQITSELVSSLINVSVFVCLEEFLLFLIVIIFTFNSHFSPANSREFGECPTRRPPTRAASHCRQTATVLQ